MWPAVLISLSNMFDRIAFDVDDDTNQLGRPTFYPQSGDDGRSTSVAELSRSRTPDHRHHHLRPQSILMKSLTKTG